MAIDPLQVQRQVIDKAQSRLAEQAQPIADAGPGQNAARFEQLMDANQGPAGSAGNSGAGNPALDQAGPAGGIGDLPGPSVPGDRILANLSSHHLQMPATDTGSVAPAGDRNSIDIGDPTQSLELQIRVAEIKAAAGLATAAVQKSTQGMDTLLKSQ